MENYILAESWKKANIKDRLYYASTRADKDAIAQKEKLSFGDKCIVIEDGSVWIFDADNTWKEL